MKSGFTMLCTPIMGTTVDQMLAQMNQAKEIGVDLVEIRLDCLKNLSPHQDLQTLLNHCPLPTIVAFRPVWAGGWYDIDEATRHGSLRLAMELGADYVDIELEIADEFVGSIRGKKPERFKLIVSSYNHRYTPSTEAIADLAVRIQAAGADIVKIVTTALDVTDCAKIFRIMVHSQVLIIGVALSERGLISRVLSPKFGGVLTYASLGCDIKSWNWEPQAKDLLTLYKFRRIRPDTKVYGIIGKPVGHSKSPLLFNAAFESEGLNSVYVHLLVDDAEKFFETYSSPDFSGYSCTIPHKEAALKCMDEIDSIAKLKIRAINNIVRRSDGGLIAFNTNYIGAINAIEDGLRGLDGEIRRGKSALEDRLFVVMGAGGAGKALAYGAAQKGARVVVANRTFERAKENADKVGGRAMGLKEVRTLQPEPGMVQANATCVGMEPNFDDTPISKEFLKHYCLVFDAIYTPKETRLLREARECGAVIVHGTEMLIRQAFEQYKSFTGLPAPEELFRKLMDTHS